MKHAVDDKIPSGSRTDLFPHVKPGDRAALDAAIHAANGTAPTYEHYWRHPPEGSGDLLAATERAKLLGIPAGDTKALGRFMLAHSAHTAQPG
jgi:hypothetical protein